MAQLPSEGESSTTTVPADYFYFISGWPPAASKYTGPVRAHVLRRHNTLRQGRSKVRRLRKHPADSDISQGNDGKISKVDELPVATVNTRSSSNLFTERLFWINFFQRDGPDPFNSLGRRITKLDALLIEEYSKHRYPWYQNVESTARFQPSRDLFLSSNAADALTIDVMVAYGSLSLAVHGSNSRIRNIVLESSCRAVRGIRERIEVESKSPSVALLVAVSGTICSSTETGEYPNEIYIKSDQINSHVRGLRNLIASYGGWQSIVASCFRLAWLIIWVDMQLNGIILNDLTQIPTPTSEIMNRPDNTPTLSLWLFNNNYSTVYTELISMYGRFHFAATFRWMFHTSVNNHSLILEPLWLFQPQTTAYRTLRSSLTFTISRLVPLLYINIILEKATQLNPSAKTELYEMYQRNLADVGFEAMPSCEILMWALMTDTRKLCFTDLGALECATRLNWAAKSFKSEDWVKLADTLCDFILLFQCQAVIGRENWWTPQQFEDIIMAREAA